MTDDITIKEIDVNPLEAVAWFSRIDEMTSVHPGEVYDTDVWAALDETGDTVGLAVVHPDKAEVTRIGVEQEHRHNGIGSALLDTVTDEYGDLELTCRRSLDANDFYEHIGWERDGVRVGEPEDLIIWSNNNEDTHE